MRLEKGASYEMDKWLERNASEMQSFHNSCQHMSYVWQRCWVYVALQTLPYLFLSVVRMLSFISLDTKDKENLCEWIQCLSIV